MYAAEAIFIFGGVYILSVYRYLHYLCHSHLCLTTVFLQ